MVDELAFEEISSHAMQRKMDDACALRCKEQSTLGKNFPTVISKEIEN